MPTLIVIAVAVVFALSPVGEILEQSMVTHMLVAYPLSIAAGFVYGKSHADNFSRFVGPLNSGGIPGVVLATFVLAFWMLPRWIDYSIDDNLISLTKYLCLVLLVGVPLGQGWEKLHPITEGLVKIELLSMLFRLGWIYLISPTRLCNNYLMSDQDVVGMGFVILAITLLAFWTIPVLFGPVGGSSKTTVPR